MKYFSLIFLFLIVHELKAHDCKLNDCLKDMCANKDEIIKPRPCKRVTYEKDNKPFETHLINFPNELKPGDEIFCEVRKVQVVDNVCGTAAITKGKVINTIYLDKWQHITEVPKTKLIKFKVRCKNDAWLGFFPAGTEDYTNKIEIYLGTGWNTEQKIRAKNLDLATTKITGILSETEERGFWIRWTDKYMEVGREGETEPFIAANIPFEPKSFGFKSVWGSTGTWTFDDLEGKIGITDNTTKVTAQLHCFPKTKESDPCESITIKLQQGLLEDIIQEYRDLRTNGDKYSISELQARQKDVADMYNRAKKQHEKILIELVGKGAQCKDAVDLLHKIKVVVDAINEKINRKVDGDETVADTNDEDDEDDELVKIVTGNKDKTGIDSSEEEIIKPIITGKKTVVYDHTQDLPTAAKCLSFVVKGDEDAFIKLSKDANTLKPSIEIGLGIDNNNKIGIYRNNGDKPVKTHKSGDVINPKTETAFWIQWIDNKIQLGRIGENTPIIEFKEPNMFKIGHVSLGSISSASNKVEWGIHSVPRCPICTIPEKRKKLCKPSANGAHFIAREKPSFSPTLTSDELKPIVVDQDELQEEDAESNNEILRF